MPAFSRCRAARSIVAREFPGDISNLSSSSWSERGYWTACAPRGGYRLARERRRITLSEIAEAVRSTEASGDPFDIPPGSPLGQEIVRPLCMDLVTTWTKELEKITIEDLCMRARENGIDSVAANTADFSI